MELIEEWLNWAASFIEEFHSSNYGVMGYEFSLQLQSILPTQFHPILFINN